MKRTINKISFSALALFFLAGGFYAGAKKQRIEVVIFKSKDRNFLESRSASAAEADVPAGQPMAERLPVTAGAAATTSAPALPVKPAVPVQSKPAQKKAAGTLPPAKPAEAVPPAPVPAPVVKQEPLPPAPTPAPEPETRVS